MNLLMIAHVVFSVLLIIVVLLQESKQAGLSGAVGGSNETFFGKNKKRTVDSMLKKLTGVFAVLFIVTSLSLAYVSTRPEEPVAPATNSNSVKVDVPEKGEESNANPEENGEEANNADANGEETTEGTEEGATNEN
ncbi:MAG: preprotein translocase subunit SecG [Ruminococcaceae bacterium]|nr:preprotein translocase subunit SecG [Oscillospiraceae bacterium]